MTLKFQGYGPGASEVHIVAARIVSWCHIDYNGRHGTEITLDTGRRINVEVWPEDVQKAVEAALKGV